MFASGVDAVLLQLWRSPQRLVIWGPEICSRIRYALVRLRGDVVNLSLVASQGVALLRLLEGDDLCSADLDNKLLPSSLHAMSMWSGRGVSADAALRLRSNVDSLFPGVGSSSTLRKAVFAGVLSGVELDTLVECAPGDTPDALVVFAVVERAVCDADVALLAKACLLLSSAVPSRIGVCGELLASDVLSDVQASELVRWVSAAAFAEALVLAAPSRRSVLVGELVGSQVQLFASVDVLLLEFRRSHPVEVAAVVDEFLRLGGAVPLVLGRVAAGPGGACVCAVMGLVELWCCTTPGRWVTFIHVVGVHHGGLDALRTMVEEFS